MGVYASKWDTPNPVECNAPSVWPVDPTLVYFCLVMIFNAKMGFNHKEKEFIASVNEFEQDDRLQIS